MVHFDFDGWVKLAFGIMAFIALIAYLGKMHFDLFIAPRFRTELRPMQRDLAIVARLMKQKYREEWETIQADVEHEDEIRG